MKTPRDWLVDRHRMEVPKLDALRRAALPAPSLGLALFGPHRVAWRTMAAVWVALALFHFTLGRPPRQANLPAPPPALLAMWVAQFNPHVALAQNDRLP
jgi:hypothetical protein